MSDIYRNFANIYEMSDDIHRDFAKNISDIEGDSTMFDPLYEMLDFHRDSTMFDPRYEIPGIHRDFAKNISDIEGDSTMFDPLYEIPGIHREFAKNIFDIEGDSTMFDPRYKMSDIHRDSNIFKRPPVNLSIISSTYPTVDWIETVDTHVFKADLAGVEKGAVKLRVVDGGILVDGGIQRQVLEISGERTIEEANNYLSAERFRGRFLRRFTLPENAKVYEAKAAMENGVLTVTVPKKPEPQHQFKLIEIC